MSLKKFAKRAKGSEQLLEKCTVLGNKFRVILNVQTLPATTPSTRERRIQKKHQSPLVAEGMYILNKSSDCLGFSSIILLRNTEDMASPLATARASPSFELGEQQNSTPEGRSFRKKSAGRSFSGKAKKHRNLARGPFKKSTGRTFFCPLGIAILIWTRYLLAGNARQELRCRMAAGRSKRW